jgi:hypothetical protein
MVQQTDDNKLKPWQNKLLVERIEETNQPYRDFDLLQACNSEPRIFGTSGTDLRRAYQYKFKYLKKLSIDKYVKFLRKHDQNPSATTQRLHLEATNAAFEATTAAFETLSFQAADEGTDDAINDTSEDEITVASNEEASQQTIYSHMSEAPSWNPEFSSPMIRSPTPFGSPPMRNTARPSPAPPINTPSAGTTEYVDHWVQPAQGTVEDPYRINVDPIRPENNREFDISYIPMKTVKGYARNVVHIRIDSVPGDHQLWEMTVPPGALRQLLIRGPSRSLHYSQEDKFHRKKECSVTYGIHKKVAEDVVKNPNRRFSHWLIQFPPEITLDNGVFSDDQIEVSRNKVGLSYDESETGITGIGTNCMMVYWEIAEKKAGLRVDAKEKEQDDADCFT